ncbi:hypothetical protein EBB05_25610 [Methylobacterium brachiatum]|nr:hypothetical protein EBB05_25610 [Methylobacterium brachiatum]
MVARRRRGWRVAAFLPTPIHPTPGPHPEAPERSGGLEGALPPAARFLEASFEAAAPHLRMRGVGER